MLSSAIRTRFSRSFPDHSVILQWHRLKFCRKAQTSVRIHAYIDRDISTYVCIYVYIRHIHTYAYVYDVLQMGRCARYVESRKDTRYIPLVFQPLDSRSYIEFQDGRMHYAIPFVISVIVVEESCRIFQVPAVEAHPSFLVEHFPNTLSLHPLSSFSLPSEGTGRG